LQKVGEWVDFSGTLVLALGPLSVWSCNPSGNEMKANFRLYDLGCGKRVEIKGVRGGKAGKGVRGQAVS